MEPITLTVNLDLDRHLAGEAIIDNDGEYAGTGPTTLEDVVLDLVADKLLAEAVRRDAQSGYPDLKDRVRKIRDEAIREQIEPTITEALAAPIRQTNSFGEPSGEPTTLRTLIAEQATAALKVSQTSNPNRFRDRDTTLSKFIGEEINRALKSELKSTLDEAKAQVLAEVQRAGGEVIADTLKRAAARF